MSVARVLLVDDHEVVRIGLRTLLAHHPGLKVAGEAGNADEAIALAELLRPDLVLMDIRLPARSGIDACAEITERCPDARVIMLTSYANDDLLCEAIAAGAVGYVLKQVGSDSLIATIEAAIRGELMLAPDLTKHVLARIRRSVDREHRDAFSALTDQEIRILSSLAQGKTNKDIGRRLSLSEKTVRNYVSSVLSKLQLESRAEASAYAVKHRLEQVLEQSESMS